MTPERLSQLRDYIRKHLRHLETYMRPLMDPHGKRILVLGSGWGTETYWALQNGASYVCGIDPSPRSTEPIYSLLREVGDGSENRFDHHELAISDLDLNEGPFDAIISNNVFEHVSDIAGMLAACRPFMTAKGVRICIFTDPLFYSSTGAHLPIPPWGHLSSTQAELKEASAKMGGDWNQYRNHLNGMTITSFLSAIREAGLFIEHLGVFPDRNRAQYAAMAGDLPPGLKPMDLLMEGISIRLAFPENI